MQVYRCQTTTAPVTNGPNIDLTNIVQRQFEIKKFKSDINFLSEGEQGKSPKYPNLKRGYNGKTFIYLAPLGFIVTLSHEAPDNNQEQIDLSEGDNQGIPSFGRSPQDSVRQRGVVEG